VSQQINLYSPIFRREKKYFSAATMALALGVVAAGVTALSVYAQMQVAVLDRQAAETSQRMNRDAARLQAMVSDKSGETRRKELEARIKEAEGALKARQQISNALNSDSLGNSKGFSSLLQAFSRQTVEGIWLTQIGLDTDNAMSISGQALRPDLVPVYLERLRREQRFRGYAFENLEIAAIVNKEGNGSTSGQNSQAPSGTVSFRLNPTGAAPVPEAQ
jgi:hypothetical protein